MDRVTLRKAGPNDSEFAFVTRRAAFREHLEKIQGWDDAEQRELHARRFAAQDFRSSNMARLVEEARELGLPIRLRVLKANTGALAFYERLGFVRTGETETHAVLENDRGLRR